MASRMFTGMAGLFLVLTVTEYFAEPGPIDIPLSLCWLIPALVLALLALGGLGVSLRRLARRQG